MKATVNSRCEVCDTAIVKDEDDVINEDGSLIHEGCRDRIALSYDSDEVCDQCWLIHSGECF